MRTVLFRGNVPAQIGYLPATLMLLLGMGLVSCSRATTEDHTRLRELSLSYQDRCVFSFEPDLYVRARCQATLSHNDAGEMFRNFWIKPNGSPRTDTTYVFLNVYDKDDKFQFQVSWDPKRKQLTFSKAEHY